MIRPIILRLATSLYLLLVVACSFSQAQEPTLIDKHVEGLRKAKDKQEFTILFEQMMADFRAGKLRNTDKQVAIVVINIAKTKSYSSDILAQVYGWAGTMFGTGNIEQALIYFMESASLYEQQHKKLAQAISSIEIALIQHNAKNYDEAEEYYLKTLELGGDSLDHRTEINCYNGLALILRERKDYINSEKDFRSALKIAEQNKDTAWIAILTGNIGSIHVRQESLDSALFYYYKNLRLVKGVPEVENEIETYGHIGRILIKKKQNDKALHYLDSATIIIRDRYVLFSDFFHPMDYINESYALLYASKGDYQKAYDYQSKFHEEAVEKLMRINGRSLKQLRATYVFREEERRNEANLVIIRQQKYTEVAFGLIVLLMTVIAFIAVRTSRIKEKLNLQLSDSNAELARLNAMKDKLFSVISHDLRTPLNNLKSVLDLIREGHLEQAEFTTMSSKLSQQVGVLGRSLENLLQWAKTQINQAKIQPEIIPLADMVENVILQFDDDRHTKSIQCQNEVDPQLQIFADRNQTEIILRNLIGNAIKFTPAGGQVSISGVLHDSLVELTVRDNGVGLSETEVEGLFQPGRIFSTPGTNQEKGTGIGLIITREMIHNNKGTIRVSSQKDKGTDFIVSLPAVS